MDITAKDLKILRTIVRKSNMYGMEVDAVINECYIERLWKTKQKHLYPAMCYAIKDLQRRILGRGRVIQKKAFVEYATQRQLLRQAWSLEALGDVGEFDNDLELIEKRDLIDMLMNEAHLTQYEKELIYYRFYQGLYVSEIGKKLKIPTTTVGRQLFRAIDKLRRVAFSAR